MGETMPKRLLRFFALWTAIAMLLLPSTLPAAETLMEDDPDYEALAMVGDAVLARPLGLAATVLGFGLFIVSSPFSALGGNADQAWYTLVERPAQFTFARPLGEFAEAQAP